jgi:hypothetical protein
MGKQSGFTGKWVILAALMLTLVIRLQPLMFYHECTIRFPYKVLEKVLGETYECFHAEMNPTHFGVPVKRPRSYDALAA